MPVSERGATKGTKPVYSDDFDRLMKQPYKPSGSGNPDFDRLMKQEWKRPNPDEEEFKKLFDKPRARPSPARVPRIRKVRLPGLAPDPIEYLPFIFPRTFEKLLPDYFPIPGRYAPPAGWGMNGPCMNMRPDIHSYIWSGLPYLGTNICIQGQAVSAMAGGGPITDPALFQRPMIPITTDENIGYWGRYDPTPNQRNRGQHNVSFYRLPGTAAPTEPLYVPNAVWPRTLLRDPNLARRGLIRQAQPLEAPSRSPQGVPQAPVAPEGGLSFGPSDRPRLDSAKVPQPIGKPEKARPPAPPGKGVKEPGKLRGPVALIIKLFKIADLVSESCEVVDSVFEALPKEVQKAAKKKEGFVWSNKQKKYVRPYGHTRAPADNYGQYGLDGCDWKAEAIYRHADKLDTCAAIQNVVKNQIEDKIHGVKEKYRPRNTVNGLKEADKQFGQDLNSLLDEIVDMCPK